MTDTSSPNISPPIAHCTSCGCKMDISSLAPYTNVVCPECGHHTRVKCELGHYLLTSRHAAGGMSMVFVARDTTLERDVAIKVLNEEYSGDEKRMEEFEREAKITAALSHPHIVRVFTVGQSFGHYYIAMELVPGENLERKISAHGAIGEEEMLPIAKEIISGLRAANSAGLIHRDMKPGNILFDKAGHAKIVDFGLALVTMGGKAKAEEIWATPYYVPPEALDGEEEDFRSDIYALGSTLYHAFSGQAPLPDEAKSTREVRKAKEHIAPISEVAPWLNPQTCYLVDKAMALRPEDRFDSYEQMEEAWNAAFQAINGNGAEEPIHSEERLRRRVRGKKKGLGGLIVLGAVALALVVTAVYFVINPGVKVDGSDVPSVPMNDEDLLMAGVGGSDDPEVAARIGKSMRHSHQLLSKGKYREAEKQFAALMVDKDIKAPMSAWLGVEAVIANWLSGGSDATAALNRLNKHLVASQASQPESMFHLSRQLQSLSIIADDGSSADSGPMEVVRLMAIALKNWELGAWDTAVPQLRKVAGYDLPSNSYLLIYKDLAGKYLSDYQSLKFLAEMEAGRSVNDVRQQLNELKQKLTGLQTRGRAKFHVRVWQIRLHRKLKEIENQSLLLAQQDARPSFHEVKPQFDGRVGKSQFAKASELLQDIRLLEGESDLRDAWVYLADSAAMFMSMLDEGVPEAGIALAMKVKDQEEMVEFYDRVVAVRSDGLFMSNRGEESFVDWSAIDPESVIDLFLKIYKPSLTTDAGRMHTELAISYAWLMGLEEKAAQAADKLSSENAVFEKRWQKTMQLMHDNP